MAYKVYAGRCSSRATWKWTVKNLIWSMDQPEYIIDPELTQGKGEIGSFTFTVPKLLLGAKGVSNAVNPYYNSFMESVTVVAIYQDDVLYWIGYVNEVVLNFDLSKRIVVEDVMGFLKRDSVFIRPLTYYVTLSDDADAQKTSLWINAHLTNMYWDDNDAPLRAPVFNQGTVNVQRNVQKDFSKDGTDVSICWDAINSRWLDEYDGYFRARYVESNNEITFYLDYTTDISETTKQTVAYGVNMLDLEYTSRIPDDFVNVVYSDRLSTTTKGWWIFATSSTNYISGNAVDEASVKKYGVYARRIVDDTATTDAALCEVCKKALVTYKQEIEKTIQVEAFDLCDAGQATDRLGFLKKTHIIAKPHGIDEWMVCTKEVLPLDKPDQKKFTFGRPPEKLTKQQNKNTTSTQQTKVNVQGLVRHAQG